MNLTPYLLVILLLSPLIQVSPAYQDLSTEVLEGRLADLLARAGSLEDKGVNVSGVIALLDRAAKYIDAGRYEDAERLLSEAEGVLAGLEEESNTVYLGNLIVKGVEAAIIASIPLAVYFLLPRFYIYTWFKLKRRWLVRR
ncbi:MAG: hypothetical protein OWQ48_01110 [Desulfurococcus sp.]|nr:hypothetical protein [Desulfurococcus sp.]